MTAHVSACPGVSSVCPDTVRVFVCPRVPPLRGDTDTGHASGSPTAGVTVSRTDTHLNSGPASAGADDGSGAAENKETSMVTRVYGSTTPRKEGALRAHRVIFPRSSPRKSHERSPSCEGRSHA